MSFPCNCNSQHPFLIKKSSPSLDVVMDYRQHPLDASLLDFTLTRRYLLLFSVHFLFFFFKKKPQSVRNKTRSFLGEQRFIELYSMRVLRWKNNNTNSQRAILKVRFLFTIIERTSDYKIHPCWNFYFRLCSWCYFWEGCDAREECLIGI